MKKLALVVAAVCAVASLAGTSRATAETRAFKPFVVSITVQRGRPVGGIKRPKVKKGRVVRFVVRTDAGKGLHLHGYDIEKAPRIGKTTVIQFTARIPGRFELELHSPDALLADLTVQP